jgi:short-subunit dehydrogenase
VIVGATSSIAEHCARTWAGRAAVDFTLVARNSSRAERVATDLKVRSPSSLIDVVQTDFLDATIIQAAVDGIVSRGPVDVVLIAHGSLPEQGNCETSLPTCREALEVNGISPVLFAEAFAVHMSRADNGVIALIGSVAGDRGRKSNYVYGAAKGMVDRYARGMQHRFAATGVKVVLIKPGPTDTPMTAHLPSKGPALAPVQDVARDIVDGIERGMPVIYTPKKWRFIMWVIVHMPAAFFNRLDI